MKILNITPLWQFHCCLSSIDYIQKYSLLKGYSDIFKNYLFKQGDSLQIILDTSLFEISKLMNIKILNKKKNEVISKNIYPGQQWKIPLKNLATGPYQCILTTQIDTFVQEIIYGNFKDVFNIEHDAIEKEIFEGNKEKYVNYIEQKLNEYSLNEKTRINLRTLFRRLYELYQFGVRNGYSASLERKIAAIFFELSTISDNILEKKEAFSHIPGLHLRGFKSDIDNTTDYYLVYIPENYNKNEKIPLVVIMPFILAKKSIFYYSWHVAKTERIDFLSKLAEEHGFAFLITNSRIYDRYNLNPIVSTATFEAIEEVKKDYNIDDNRMYLYGDCSGGLSALLLANRFPSQFAAICVEGPEINYTLCEYYDDPNCQYPKEWVKENNIFNFIHNYKNIPLYIIHSKNDQKAIYELSDHLVNELNKIGGQAILDTNYNPSKTKDISMNTENYNYAKVFSFFNNKVKKIPDKIEFSTSQIKYNKADWVSLENINYHHKASIEAFVENNNIIKVNTANINSYSLHLNEIPGIEYNNKIKVISNGIISYADFPENDKIMIYVTEQIEKKSNYNKNSNVEGPINHIFSKSFLVVKGTQRNERSQKLTGSIADEFVKNWEDNYFEPCKMKKDVNITSADIQNNNLILCGTNQTNLIISKIYKDLPLIIMKDYIKLCGKIYNEENLFYIMVYPNPLNQEKYILLLGSNGDIFEPYIIYDLSYTGWFDYEIYSQNKMTLIDRGYFNKYWQ